MRTRLGTFRCAIEVLDAAGERAEAVAPWVHTGALYSQLPAPLLEGLGYGSDTMRRFRLADGSVLERPIGDVRLRIRDETRTVTCVFGGELSEMLLGATTLDAFSLAPDPVNETLNPTIAMLLALTPAEDPPTRCGPPHLPFRYLSHPRSEAIHGSAGPAGAAVGARR